MVSLTYFVMPQIQNGGLKYVWISTKNIAAKRFDFELSEKKLVKVGFRGFK